MNCPKCKQPMKTAVMDARPSWYCHDCGEVLFRQTTGLMDVPAQVTPAKPETAVRGAGKPQRGIARTGNNKYRAERTEVEGIVFDSKRDI